MGLFSKLLKASIAKKAFEVGRRELSKPSNQQKIRRLLSKRKG